MKNIEIKQIILVTDGKSNIGGDPVMASKEAIKNDIVVSAIGIASKTDSNEDPISEIQSIAKIGQGQWEITYIDNLSETLQMMTQKTMNKTIGSVVNKELREIIGSELNDIKPQFRNKFVEYIESLGDEILLKCCILVDCSGSMKPKLKMAKDSIIDLMSSLKARKGKSEIAIISYPGTGGEMTSIVSDFTDDLEVVKNRIINMNANGTTPTAPAIYKAIGLFTNRCDIVDEIIEEDSLLGDNIV